MSIDTVKISHRGRYQLIALKKRTGIANWNILCRWAFCISMAVKEKPRDLEKKEHSSDQPTSGDELTGTEGASENKDRTVEMTWATFGGEQADIYLALLKARCIRDGLEPAEENLSHQLKLHLHRGIGYLGKGQVKNIIDLVSKTLTQPSPK